MWDYIEKHGGTFDRHVGNKAIFEFENVNNAFDCLNESDGKVLPWNWCPIQQHQGLKDVKIKLYVLHTNLD